MGLIRRVRGRRVTRAEPCRGWGPPDVSHLKGTWRRASARSLLHVTLDEAQKGPPTPRLTLCPWRPRYPLANEEALTPRVSFTRGDMAQAFLALGEWANSPPTRQRGRGGPLWPRTPQQLAVYANRYPVWAYQPTVEEVPDVESTEEVWALQPTPVALLGVIPPTELFAVWSEVADFAQTANRDGIRSALIEWGMEDDRDWDALEAKELYHTATMAPFVLDLLRAEGLS